ncbi:hypothetical protein HZH68_014080 [Vespula germanica]|uniref:Uncharacterized protein n=1 Tax=Vespula germanica TaxID=30212 RepID=A0A834MVH0_VESGE|nr:hypothetical protein HZH68_014080 [Vespula germanica]
MKSFVLYFVTFLLMMSPFLTMAHPLGIKGDELLNISNNGTSVKLPEIDLSEVRSLPGDPLKLPILISGSDMKCPDNQKKDVNGNCHDSVE